MKRFGQAEIAREPLAGGGFVLRSRRELAPVPRGVSDVLAHWASAAPERPFLVERNEHGAWIASTYRATFENVRALGQSLLDLGLDARRPLMLLSGNGIDHAHLTLAAMHAGVPAAPVSTAFSLATRDPGRLLRLFETLAPGALFAEGAAFAPAVSALPRELPLLVSRDASAFSGREVLLVSQARRRAPREALDEAASRVGPDTVAKILFTSGSTGWPRGVVNTQRMLCSNQVAMAMNWPFLAQQPPRVVDWLPWSHTFGGNHNLLMVLWHGGTLWIDSGKPMPGAFEATLSNLREISPTVYFNVPRGFDLLASALERDADLAARFFGDLEFLFYAASALPQSTWDRLARLSLRARGEIVPMISGWGSTETAPMVTQVHFPVERASVIGVPIPGCEVAFVPAQGRHELRVKGPNVSPGFWRPGGAIEPLLLDERGFYAMGDAGRLADDAAPEKGVMFDGRLAENFKLSSGTWVRVGELRVALIAACAPLAQDFVVAGHDRDELGVLVFPNAEFARDPELESRLRERLSAFNAMAGGSSAVVRRALVMREPPSLDAGEITDKGYVNQRAVLARRTADVERLFGEDDRLVRLP